MSSTHIDCELCRTEGGNTLWRDDACRIVLVEGDEGEAFPGFCRVIWNAHVAEMSDLAPREHLRLMQCVVATESTLRRLLEPDKINLASLGNMTPHLHWHVIPRWRDDSHFPAPIWAPARRSSTGRTRFSRDALHAALQPVLLESLGQ